MFFSFIFPKMYCNNIFRKPLLIQLSPITKIHLPSRAAVVSRLCTFCSAPRSMRAPVSLAHLYCARASPSISDAALPGQRAALHTYTLPTRLAHLYCARAPPSFNRLARYFSAFLIAKLPVKRASP